ncbi:MAG TPA: signal peptide peptidase SppA, partial [Cytophagaceae bacterium]
SMLVRSAEDALNFKLVTDLGYYSEVLDYLKKEKLALAENEKIKFVRYTDLNDKAINEESMVSGKSKIVVIYGTGSIEDGKSDQNSIGSYTFSEEIRKARLDEDVKAIVLRINSPGGSALASDVIWKEVELTKKVKPVVASMSDMAASGGYYIAMACDTIIAHPTTITGSIGVFGVLMNGKEFLEDKLGVTADRVTTGKFSDIGSFTRPITEFEKQIIQKEVERIYDQFTLKAAQGRQISVETMRDELAEGRVWSGIEAKNNKLVDGFGNLDDAIAIAAEMANQKEYQVVYWPEQKTTFLTQLIRQMEEEESKAIKLNLGSLYPVYKTIQNADKLNGVQARIPYELIIR